MISKSRFLSGRQCLKRLWLLSSGREEPVIEPDIVLEDREADGAAVERVAEQLFPGLIRLGEAADDDEEREQRPGIEERTAETVRRLGEGRTLAQAHLAVDELLAICDVLEARDGEWFVWEVKSSKSEPGREPKALYDWDLAFQVHVARRMGLRIAGAGLLLLRGDYVRGADEPAPEDLIVRLDRSARVDALLPEVEAELASMREAIARPRVPSEWPSSRCKASRGAAHGRRPSTCGHLTAAGECGRHLPEHWVGHLPRLPGAKAAWVASTRYKPIDEVDPNDADLNWSDAQKRVIRAVQAGRPEIDPARLRAELDTIEWPVSYVDFEFDPGMALPRFEGSMVYDRLPFQWALVVQERPGGAVGEPRSFLHLDGSDPRRPFAESLLDALPPTGSIVAHHAPAETQVLRQLADRLGGAVGESPRSLAPRFRDTAVIARAGYYHPAQKGSYSIKQLAPALVGRGYDDLGIQSGMLAVAQWRRATDPSVSADERDRLREDLLAYCGRDAELMHAILEELRRLSGWRAPASS